MIFRGDGVARKGTLRLAHAITDALGNPLDFTLTAGQSSRIRQAGTLLQPTPLGAVTLLGDISYNSDVLAKTISETSHASCNPAAQQQSCAA